MENYKKSDEYKKYIKPILKKVNISKIQQLSDDKYALIKNKLLYGTITISDKKTSLDITFSNHNRTAYKMDLYINKEIEDELDISFSVLSMKNGGNSKFVDSSYIVSKKGNQGRIHSSNKDVSYFYCPFDSCRSDYYSFDDEIFDSYKDTIIKTLKLVNYKK